MFALLTFDPRYADCPNPISYPIHQTAVTPNTQMSSHRKQTTSLLSFPCTAPNHHQCSCPLLFAGKLLLLDHARTTNGSSGKTVCPDDGFKGWLRRYLCILSRPTPQRSADSCLHKHTARPEATRRRQPELACVRVKPFYRRLVCPMVLQSTSSLHMCVAVYTL